MYVLIHLGDVSFYDHEAWHKRLMSVCCCKRWLVRGNHDCEPDGWYLKQGWDCVVDGLSMVAGNKRVYLSHKPVPIDTKTFDLNIHGHVHNKKQHEFAGKLTNKHILVRCEHDYRPVLLHDLLGVQYAN